MIKSQSSNYQDLLKTIAIVAMLIDHLGLWFLPDLWWMRSIGRFVMPIFCFYAGYNYSAPKHLLLKLGILLTALLYIALGFNSGLNMLLSIYIGQWYIYLMDKYRQNSALHVLIHCTILILLMLPTMDLIEYGTLVIAFMIVGRYQALTGNGLSFIPLLSISGMMMTFVVFEGYLSLANMIGAFCSIGAAGFALSARRPESLISVDLRIISRNSLIIYFINVSICAIAFLAMSLI
jgi:hypothetical protein